MNDPFAEILDLADSLHPGDELPAAYRWEVRDHCWWIVTEDGATGCSTQWVLH
jgi:hypothetical protein